MRERRPRKSLVILLSSRADHTPIIASLELLKMAIDSGEVQHHEVHVLIMTDRPAPPELISAVEGLGLNSSFLNLGLFRLAQLRVIWLLSDRWRVPLVGRVLKRRRSWQSTYLPKVRMALRFARQKGFGLVVKCDDDAVLSPTAWRVLLVDARSKLDDDSCVLVTPALSSGIPTWLDYARALLTEDELAAILLALRQVQVPSTIWGVDYSAVLESQRDSMWDEAAYQESMRQLHHYYKGFHPIRFDARSCANLVAVAVAKVNQFLAWVPSSDIMYRHTSDYICNVAFAMTPDTYGEAIDSEHLLVDAFDEVPLNALISSGERHYLVATNAPAVHLMYNTAYGQPVMFDGQLAQSRELEAAMARALVSAIETHRNG